MHQAVFNMSKAHVFIGLQQADALLGFCVFLSCDGPACSITAFMCLSVMRYSEFGIGADVPGTCGYCIEGVVFGFSVPITCAPISTFFWTLTGKLTSHCSTQQVCVSRSSSIWLHTCNCQWHKQSARLHLFQLD